MNIKNIKDTENQSESTKINIYNNILFGNFENENKNSYIDNDDNSTYENYLSANINGNENGMINESNKKNKFTIINTWTLNEINKIIPLLISNYNKGNNCYAKLILTDINKYIYKINNLTIDLQYHVGHININGKNCKEFYKMFIKNETEKILLKNNLDIKVYVNIYKVLNSTTSYAIEWSKYEPKNIIVSIIDLGIPKIEESIIPHISYKIQKKNNVNKEKKEIKVSIIDLGIQKIEESIIPHISYKIQKNNNINKEKKEIKVSIIPI